MGENFLKTGNRVPARADSERRGQEMPRPEEKDEPQVLGHAGRGGGGQEEEQEEEEEEEEERKKEEGSEGPLQKRRWRAGCGGEAGGGDAVFQGGAGKVCHTPS